jgi:hypothetical protein
MHIINGWNPTGGSSIDDCSASFNTLVPHGLAVWYIILLCGKESGKCLPSSSFCFLPRVFAVYLYENRG